MAEMVGAAVVQEAISRVWSFVLDKREEKASQGHLRERLEMAVRKMDFALERSAKLPILDGSLLPFRAKIKCDYAKAKDLLEKNKQQAVPAGQEQMAQGVKRKRSWITLGNKNLSVSSSARLTTDDVVKYESCGVDDFLRFLELGYSPLQYNIGSGTTILRRLLEGKTLRYRLQQGNQLRDVEICRARFVEERGVEAVLMYYYKEMTETEEKSLILSLILRLSATTDILGVATKALEFLTSPEPKLLNEPEVKELNLLPTLLHDSCVTGCHESFGTMLAQFYRNDPACCAELRHTSGNNNNNNVSSELSHMLPEEIIFCTFISSRSTSYEDAGRSTSSRGRLSPLSVSVGFAPHHGDNDVVMLDSRAVVSAGNVLERRDNASIQQVMDTLKSDAISCFVLQPELTKYRINWRSKHGCAWFVVEKPRVIERIGGGGDTRRGEV